MMKLRINNLYKSYGTNEVLKNISLEMKPGLYGLLGINGAGKSTLIKIIVGLEKADAGEVSFIKDDVTVNILDHIGYLPQSPAFYKDFTAYEFIEYLVNLKTTKSDKNSINSEVNRVLDDVNLLRFKDQKIGEYSGGMKQRLSIAAAMIYNPDILILDEPTVGLDLLERINFRNLLSRLAEEKIIILATHIVSDVEFISNEILIIDKGEIKNRGTTDHFTEYMKGKTWTVKCANNQVEYFLNNYLVSNIGQEDEEYILKILSDTKPHKTAINSKASLEDFCVYFYGEKNEIRN